MGKSSKDISPPRHPCMEFIIPMANSHNFKAWAIVLFVILSIVSSAAYAQRANNQTQPPWSGPIIKWKDIYGRDESGQRMNVHFSLGIDGRGAGSKYFVKGQYSEIHGEYYGAWAEFKEHKIEWDFNKVLQLDTINTDKPGWYIKGGETWIKE